jgi:hypothetical protein
VRRGQDHGANANPHQIFTFFVDPDAGTLTPTGSTVSAPSPSFSGVVLLASP